MFGHVVSQKTPPQMSARFCRSSHRPNNLTWSHRSEGGHFFVSNTELSEAALEEELGNTRKTPEPSFGRNFSPPLSETCQLSETLPSLSSARVNSQIQNIILQDKCRAFQIRESAMPKHISDLRSQFDDLTHL
jgi:hypothetical protein